MLFEKLTPFSGPDAKERTMKALRIRSNEALSLKRKIRTRAISGLSAIAVLGLALTGCSAAEPTSTSTQGTPDTEDTQISGTLNLYTQGDQSAAVTESVLTQAFQAKYPNVKVVTQFSASTSWDAFFTDLQTAIAGGANLDLVYVPTEGQRLFAGKGLIEPLDSYLERDQADMVEFNTGANASILKMAKEKASTDGQTYFIPYLYNTMGVYYNKQVFAQADVEAPSGSWTWDDLENTMAQLKAAGVQYPFSLDNGLFTGISPWLLTNGANVLNDDWSESTINSPAAVEAVDFAAKIVADGYSPIPGGKFNVNQQFAQGNVAMFGGGAWPTGGLLSSGLELDDFGIAPWPKNVRQGSPVGWGSQGLLASSENKEAGWAYIKFLTSPEAQDLIGLNRLNSALPILESSIDKASSVYPEGYKYLFDALDYSSAIPGPSASIAIQQAVQDTYLSILTGQQRPEEGMKKLDGTIAPLLK
jgi:ABC-type glycerol-3-phosphate transport system substrate-binding protein